MIIRKLRLIGTKKNYECDFGPGLNIIAGQISTGKTSILEIIDYCLGAKSHPEHIEIERNVYAALLEIDLPSRTVVIERPLFSRERKAIIHECSIDEINENHVRLEVSAQQLPTQESISSYLLKNLGLHDVLLKEAPTRDSSGTDSMSFRDLMGFCYLKHERLDNKELLYESIPMKNIKLQQVFDVLYDIHKDRLVQLSQRKKELERKASQLEGEIKTLSQFLDEKNIEHRDKLEENLKLIKLDEIKLASQLHNLNDTLRGESNIGQQMRDEIVVLDDEIKKLSAIKRDREKLLKRLVPLRGQYSEDTKKLRFLQEAKDVFDPLSIVVCPCCFRRLPKDQQEKVCKLCGHELSRKADDSFDINREIRVSETKLRDLNNFIQDTTNEINSIKINLKAKMENIAGLQAKLDEVMKEYVSPYLAERDKLVADLNVLRQKQREIEKEMELHQGIEDRIAEKNRIDENIQTIQSEIDADKSKAKDRNKVIKDVQKRFSEILTEIRYPKLAQPEVDGKLIPYVRGLPYRKIGSSGGMTLLSVSWFLSIFENAVESGAHHPGFVLIDSPQKNIGISASDADKDFRDTSIVESLYNHLISKAKEYGDRTQWIIIDNKPPSIAHDFVKIRYSGDKDDPPYGLIDDEYE